MGIGRSTAATSPQEAVKIRSPKTERAFRKHYMKWSSCDLCPLHAHVRYHVIGSGRLPCDVVFVGEAPGEMEDAMGRPFIGPAGRILTLMLEDVVRRVEKQFTYAITNVVCCKPFKYGSPIVPPPRESIEACRPRLMEFLSIANPRLIVALGKVADGYLPKELPAPKIHVWHPSYVLRNGGQTSLEFKKVVHQLVEVFKRTFE